MKSMLQYRRKGRTIRIALTRSAPIQIKPFPRIGELCTHWREKGYCTVVEVGCGRLRNALVLVKHFRLWVTDFPEVLSGAVVKRRLERLTAHDNFMGFLTPKQFAKRRLNADAAVLAFVLHTLPTTRMRTALVRNAIRNTRAPHETFVAVPNGEHYYRQRMRKGNQLQDGYFYDAGRGYSTFYREYSAADIDGFMKHIGFVVEQVFTSDKKNQRTYVMPGIRVTK